MSITLQPLQCLPSCLGHLLVWHRDQLLQAVLALDTRALHERNHSVSRTLRNILEEVDNSIPPNLIHALPRRRVRRRCRGWHPADSADAKSTFTWILVGPILGPGLARTSLATPEGGVNRSWPPDGSGHDQRECGVGALRL
eukprot:9470320-Pyramimonas_sp.AAC.1